MSGERLPERPRDECFYCADEPEPGWIEVPNNGPIVRCPICNDPALRTAMKENDDHAD